MWVRLAVTWQAAKRQNVLIPSHIPPTRLVCLNPYVRPVCVSPGYHTATIGKYHVGANPRTHGFDLNIAGTTRGGPATYFSPYSNPALPDGPRGEYLTDRLTQEALAYLDTRAALVEKVPFFLYLAFFTVRMPYEGKVRLCPAIAAWLRIRRWPQALI